MPFLADKHVPIPNKDILSWMFDKPNFDQDKPIYIDAKDPSRSISARQARVIIRQLTAGLHAAGLQKNDCVCIHSFNDINYSMIFLGVIAAGGVFAGSNPGYTEYELKHHFKASEAKFLITEPEMLEKVLAAAKPCNIPQSNVWIFDVLGQDVPSGFQSWEALKTYGEEDWVRFDDEKISRETIAARLFSSGTTGLPKAAMLSHYNFIAEHTLTQEQYHKPYQVSRVLCLPMFHAAVAPVAHTTPLRSGHVSYVMRRFELEPYIQSIERFAITEAGVLPPLVLAILMSPDAHRYNLTSVLTSNCGAAPLDKDLQGKFERMLSPQASCTQVWGMTETCCIASMFPYTEKDDTGSVGRFLPNIDVKIIDEDGNDITAYDVRGELCVRGPTITSGYLSNEAANASSFDSEGYFKTGDVVYCDGETKKWYIVDRKKELIKVRAFQVAPPEIEAVLLSHPQIIDAAVIGVAHPAEPDIEHPRAFVVKRPGAASASLDEKAIRLYCGERLSKYKELTGGVAFLEAIPKNASGKILKRVLRDAAKAEFQRGISKL